MMNWRRFYTFLIEDNDNGKDKIMVSTILPRISSETNDKDKGSDKGKGTYHHARRVLSGSQGYGHVSPTLAEATKKPNFKIGWASFFLDGVTFRLLSVGSHFNPWTGPLGTERKKKSNLKMPNNKFGLAFPVWTDHPQGWQRQERQGDFVRQSSKQWSPPARGLRYHFKIFWMFWFSYGKPQSQRDCFTYVASHSDLCKHAGSL